MFQQAGVMPGNLQAYLHKQTMHDIQAYVRHTALDFYQEWRRNIYIIISDNLSTISTWALLNITVGCLSYLIVFWTSRTSIRRPAILTQTARAFSQTK